MHKNTLLTIAAVASLSIGFMLGIVYSHRASKPAIETAMNNATHGEARERLRGMMQTGFRNGSMEQVDDASYSLRVWDK